MESPGTPPPPIQCFTLMTTNVLSGWAKFVTVFFVYLLSRLAHHLLKPLSQPFITSDILIGLFMGNLPFVRDKFQVPFTTQFDQMVDFGIICYMFVLGLEMDPYVIFKPPSRHVVLAYGGMLCTFLLACATTPWLHLTSDTNLLRFTVALSVALSATASHVLTRIITNLKIGKSDIGRLAIAASIHSDMVSMLLLSLGFIVFPSFDIDRGRIRQALIMGIGLLLQILFISVVSPFFMKWVNDENPEGKPLKGSHLVLSMAFIVAVCSCSPWFGYNHVMSAFVAGLFLPSDGRISKWTISKLNYLLTTLFYPFFLFYAGYKAELKHFAWGNVWTYIQFFVLLGVAMLGKVAGTVIFGAILGLHLPELVALGLLLTAKGHFHIFLGLYALKERTITVTQLTIMVFVTLSTIAHTPFVVKHIIERARKRVPAHRKALQWLQPSTELRILLCVHGMHNVPSALNFMEISRGTVNPGVVVFVTDMIELTDQVAVTMEQGEAGDAETVTDKSVTQMREQLTHAFQTYVDENGGGITLRRMLALSTFNTMAQDISVLAEDLMVYLIVLPFHKRMNPDGTLDAGHSGFRYVNRKLLRNAPCSIGILVDRGFGFRGRISRSSPALNVAIIFIGGKDDREALAYASRVARHGGVKLTVIRFLVDKTSENAPRRVNYRVNQAEQEEEMKLDDECFAEFYEKYVAGGSVAYTEKHQANSSETFMSLRSLEGQYSLIIVGRGGRVNTVLTMGLNDWQQCPELGPVGDVLSGTGFAGDTSVLIIQQHSFKGQLDGLSDEFSIM